MENKCPKCHAEGIIQGKVYNQIDYVNPPAFFRANSVPFYAMFVKSIPLDNNFYACSFCGLMWSKLNNQLLQQRSNVSRGAI